MKSNSSKSSISIGFIKHSKWIKMNIIQVLRHDTHSTQQSTQNSNLITFFPK